LTVDSLANDRYLLGKEVERWKSQYTKLLEVKHDLQKSIDLIVEKTSMTLVGDEDWKSKYEEVLAQNTKLQDNLNLLKSAEVTPDTTEIFAVKEDLERYKNLCAELNKQIENLESHAEKREEQIAGELERIEKLEADLREAKSKNAVLPEPAVKFLQSEVIRLKGELNAAKEAVEHFRKQPAAKVKSGRKVSGDEATVMDAIEFAMNKTAAAWSADSGYSHPERLVEKMYSEWMEEAQK
jgi:chromosome segregation ATPase